MKKSLIFVGPTDFNAYPRRAYHLISRIGVKEDIDTCVITPYQPHPSLDISFIKSPLNYFKRISFIITTLDALVRDWDRENNNLSIICSGPLETFAVSIICKRLNFPFIVDFNDIYSSINLKWKLFNPLFIHALKKADRVLIPNKLMKKYLIKSKIHPRKISYLPNGFNEECLQFPTPSFNPSSIKVGFSGDLNPFCGVDTLLLSCATLMNVHVHIVGDGSKREEFQYLSDTLGLSNVTFHGLLPHSKALEVIADCDFVVVPSPIFQGGVTSHLKFVEALALNKTLIVSHTSKDLDKLVGLIHTFEPGNYVELRDKIQNATRYGEGSFTPRDYIKDQTWENLAKRLEGLLWSDQS